MKKKTDKNIQSFLGNQKGFSILQILAAGAMLGIFVTAFFQSSELQTKALKTSEASFDALDFVDQVRNAMSDPQNCLSTFQGQNYSTTYSVNTIYKSYIDPSTGSKTQVPLVKVGDDISKNIKLTKVSLKNVDGINRKGFIELRMLKTQSGLLGSKEFVRDLQIIVIDTDGNGMLDQCFSTGTSVGDPVELCESLGGNYDFTENKCQGIVAYDPNPVYCAKFAKRRLVQVNQKLKIECTACNVVDKFDHWECGHIPGKTSYSNLCYYRKVCQDSTNDTLSPALWDGKQGPTSAGGGDTATGASCVSKRKRCAGEPAGLAEGQVAP